MYNRPLVITDNVFLASQFKRIFDVLFPNIGCIAYAISKQSNAKYFEEYGIFANFIDLKDQQTINWMINTYDIVFSVHCKQIFPPSLVKNIKCINLHPGYNPYNRGWYPQVFAILNNLPIGATIHEIDEELDHGPIIARQLIEKYDWDTSESLYNRVQQAEIELMETHLESIMEGTYRTISPEKKGQVYLRKDFQALCEIDLNEKVSFQEAINRLRALTHGAFKNAYFIGENGNKNFICIQITQDGNDVN